jgi:hypothetical protein
MLTASGRLPRGCAPIGTAVQRPHPLCRPEKFRAPGRTRTCATGSGGQSDLSTASFWCVLVLLNWPASPRVVGFELSGGIHQ